jgi:ATP-binding cassette subfamily B protein
MIWEAAPRHLSLMLLLQATGAAAGGSVILLIRNVVAALLRPGRDIGGILLQLGLLVVVLAYVAVSGGLQRQLQMIMGELVVWNANERLIDVTTAVDLAAYDDPDFHDLLERATQSVGRPFGLTQTLLGLVGSVATLASFAAALFVLNPLLVPVALLTALPLWFSTLTATRARRELELGLMENNRRRGYLSWIVTSAYGAKDVRAFRLDLLVRPVIRALFDVRLRELRRLALRGAGLAIGGSIAMAVGIGLTVSLVAYLVVDGRMGLAAAAAAAAAIIQVGPVLSGLAWSVGVLYESVLFIEDYEQFCAMKPAIDAGRPSQPAPASFDRIAVEGVSFTYPSSGQPALRDVSIQLRRGEIVALVGENGSGKTTLAKLLCQLYRPDQGRILWDDRDTSDMDPELLRRSISVIFQDFGQWWLSVRQNIGMGRLERLEDDAGIEAAARRSGAHVFIDELPERYATMLGPIFESGKNLSIGQWQRMALARAFFRDAPLVILDEPTAALDARAEHDLFEHIRELYGGHTILLISHRFSSVRMADRIYVLDRGEVVEHGSHDDLMAHAGLYADLFRLQAAAYLEPAPRPAAGRQ